MQKINNDLENKIIDLYNQGYKIKDISKICKVYPTTVSRVANRNSLCRECSKLTLSEKINICKLYNLGKTCSDIAKLYNVSRNTISTILHNNNINIRRSNLDTYFEEAVQMYSNGYSLTQISNKYEFSRSNFSIRLKKLGIPVINTQNMLKFNEHIFDIIDTEEKAYWLGFIFADGYIASIPKNGKPHYNFEVSLKGSDVEHLYKLQKFFQVIGNRVKISSIICNNKQYFRCRFALTNKHLWETLNSYGCTPKKSLTLKFPNENIFKSKDLIRHFIRGYFDGDGCLSYGGSKNIFKPRCCIVGTKNILQNIEVYSNTSWTWYVANKTSDLIFDIKSNINNSIKFLQWIYENSTIYLNRKYYRYLCFKNHNFAVSKSDFRDNDRVISEKAKLYVQNNYPNFVYKHVNTEIIK